MLYHPVLIVGGGLAGLRAAIALYDAGVDCAVISRAHPVRSHSVAAQGGINAALGNAEGARDDTWEKHAYDTVKGSDFLADQKAVAVMTREAPARVYEMEHWGCPFSRLDDGRIAQRPFGGAGYPRTCYAADKTGHALLHTMWEQCVKRNIKTYQEFLVLSLSVREGQVRGLIALNILTGEILPLAADAILFATGGAGRIFGRSTNALLNTGSGMAIAYLAGVPLKDLEFIQFHPTGLYGTNILMTEGCRGEGGYLLNAEGKRFMEKYAAKAMELAPRDIVARSIQTEINEGRGLGKGGAGGGYVYLDLRHLGAKKIMDRLPGIRDICLNFAGIDPIDTPIPVQPSQHYTMGGIDTDVSGASPVQGFYAAGECACVSVHGANRLGGNSLLDTIVFGKLAGDAMADYVHGSGGGAGVAGDRGPGQGAASAGQAALEEDLRQTKSRAQSLLEGEGTEDPAAIRESLKSAMIEKVGIYRSREPLAEALATVRELQQRAHHIKVRSRAHVFNLDLVNNIELAGMLAVAEVVALGALQREESRGSHFRLDFPKRGDEQWLKHTRATYSPAGPQLQYTTVDISQYQPVERKY
ncbi:MAG: FAD-dependent oxidoreductase [Symbiobacteriia bacterium]